MRAFAIIVLSILFLTPSYRAEADPNGVIKEFETKESIKQWATNAHGGAQFLEFTNKSSQFMAVSLRHTWGAPSSEVFLFKFRYGRWAALLHLGDPEFDATVAIKRNRFQVWKRYYSSKVKAGEQKRLYVEYDLDALERDP